MVLIFRLQYLIYQSLWLIFSFFLLIYIAWFYRGYRNHNSRLFERFGFGSKDKIHKKKYWLHLASVGEVKTALPFIQVLLKEIPLEKFLFTTNTPTGEKILKECLGYNVEHCYMTFDFYLFVKRFLKNHDPCCLLLFETEVWPSLIVESFRYGFPILLINARMSKKSHKNYMKFSKFSKTVFEKINLVLAQFQEDSDRFLQLGAKIVKRMGSLKFDQSPHENLIQKAEKYKKKLNHQSKRQIILAASVHPEEVEIILESFLLLNKERPNLLLLLAPRHPQTFNSIYEVCQSKGFKLERKSDNNSVSISTEILLIDTMGELHMLCGCADVAIMGGTFIEHGGHNFLEPAAWGVPIVSGTSDYNFSYIANGLRQCGALLQVANKEELISALNSLLIDEQSRQNKANAAIQFVKQNQGSINNLRAYLKPYLNLDNT